VLVVGNGKDVGAGAGWSRCGGVGVICMSCIIVE